MTEWYHDGYHAAMARQARQGPAAAGEGGGDADPGLVARQAEMLANRLGKTARHLARWARRESVTCWRAYDRDIPEVALTIDRYERHVVVAELAREGRPPGWLDAMVAAAAAALEVPVARVVLRRRERQKDARQYGKLGDARAEIEVGEGGHRFIVNLSDYLDTGLFLDHRRTRALVAAEAAGKRFLNLFAYTGAFTVYAAAAGARTTTSVDLSNRYLAWARANLERNRLLPGHHKLVRADVLAWLAEAGQRRDRWDLVVLDPPTFSRSKAMTRDLDVQRDHVPMLAATLGLVAPGGVIYFSTNFRTFRFDDGAVAAAGGVAEEITHKTVPPDFPRRPHRCWRIVKA